MKNPTHIASTTDGIWRRVPRTTQVGPSERSLSEPRPNLARSLWQVVGRRLREYWQHRRIMRACEESRNRMNGYTREQRDQLYQDAMKIINSAKPPANVEISHDRERRKDP